MAREVKCSRAELKAGPYLSLEDWAVFPLTDAHLGVNITDKLGLILEGDGISLGNDWSVDGAALLHYQITLRWDLSAGYRYFNRGIDTSDLKNQLTLNRVILAVGFSF